MLPVTLHTVVLWAHIVGACVWIGGQAVMAAVIPAMRNDSASVRVIARRYQQIAWPAFGILMITGVINLATLSLARTDFWVTAVGHTVIVKLVLVLVSGVCAAFHAFVQAPRQRMARAPSVAVSATLGGISFLSALGAALYGVVLVSG